MHGRLFLSVVVVVHFTHCAGVPSICTCNRRGRSHHIKVRKRAQKSKHTTRSCWKGTRPSSDKYLTYGSGVEATLVAFWRAMVIQGAGVLTTTYLEPGLCSARFLLSATPHWPPSLTLRRRLAALQRRTVAAAMRVPRMPGEGLAAYCRRRARAASAYADRVGSWDRGIVIAATSWAAHVGRRPQQHRVRRLLCGGREQWLRERRMAVGSPSAGGPPGLAAAWARTTAMGDSPARCMNRCRPASGRDVTRCTRAAGSSRIES